MTEKHIFADVEQPFHVWVKEGTRWVLRDAAPDLRIEANVARAPGNERGTAVTPSGAA